MVFPAGGTARAKAQRLAGGVDLDSVLEKGETVGETMTRSGPCAAAVVEGRG